MNLIDVDPNDRRLYLPGIRVYSDPCREKAVAIGEATFQSRNWALPAEAFVVTRRLTVEVWMTMPERVTVERGMAR